MASKQRIVVAVAVAGTLLGALCLSQANPASPALGEASDQVRAAVETVTDLRPQRRARALPTLGHTSDHGIAFLAGDQVDENYNPPVARTADRPSVQIDQIPDGVCGTTSASDDLPEPIAMPAPNMRQPSQDEAFDAEALSGGSMDEPSELLVPDPAILEAQREYLERASELTRKGASAAHLAELKAKLLADE